jgi:hypothetical protein
MYDPPRAILSFRPLGPVKAPALPATLNSGGIEMASYNMVFHSREIFNLTAPDEDDTVLLELVADTRNIGGHFDAIREPDPSDLTKG